MPRRSASVATAPRAARTGVALLGLMLLATASAPLARAESVHAIRVRLNPNEVAAGALTAERQTRLEMQIGTKLTPVGTTRTGAIELELATPQDAAELRPRLAAMRRDRSVLWVEPSTAGRAAKGQRAAGAPAGHGAGAYVDVGQKLLVRLAGDPSPDWSTLMPRLVERMGAAAIPERQLGNVWVLRLMAPVRTDRLAQIAAALEEDPAVQYADPVRRRFAKLLVPNDPYFATQWALTDPVGGINVQAAWDLQLQTAPVSTTVAVVDTGILNHADLANRLLPGYDFITDPGYARDGDGRDPDPTDSGDWMDQGACGGFPAHPSSWHGTFVTGIIAGDVNNGIGMSGVDLYAQIVPVRVLGECGGTDEDVFEGMLWASGVQIAGVPPNPFPAKVINMSLGGAGSCPNAVQDAIDDALAQGSVVVVAAGNESSNTIDFAPSGCSGVINVAATNRAGDITFYSNFGQRVDIAAPGGDFDDGGVLSLSNDGQTGAGSDAYANEIGTSAAAPQVSGVVSMMLARDPTLTAGRVLSILQGTAREFRVGSVCRNGAVCGAGILDAGLALASTIPGGLVPPAGATPVVEYYRADLDHYYYTADPLEISFFDGDPTSPDKRTGFFFFAWPDSTYAPPGAQPVCKFYGSTTQFIDSYYYTADPAECAFVAATWPGTWTLVNPAVFWVMPVYADGSCPAGTIATYRFDNNRKDFNQRHTIDLSVRRAMINRAWPPSGPGRNGAGFCTPI
ncbi:MAG TPA: S8 family peptidase [Casimicrobiaceae bacterium]|nr:S8 family peptidase [Casimicrobiaceae bacterium]